MECFITNLGCGDTAKLKQTRLGYDIECSNCLVNTGQFRTEREASAKQAELLQKPRTVEEWRSDLRSGRSVVDG